MFWKVLLLVSIVSLGLQLAHSCDIDQIRQGCRIQNRGCSCGAGCISEYRYETIQECHSALRGKRSNICVPSPCLHGGSCLQISQQPGYRCRCEGTGYFGARCNRACPVPSFGGIGDGVFPYECIII